jgi:hypothetical protein
MGSASFPVVWLANCYFAPDSLGLLVLLPFFASFKSNMGQAVVRVSRLPSRIDLCHRLSGAKESKGAETQDEHYEC